MVARLRRDGTTSLINRAHTRADKLNLTNIFDNVSAANTLTLAYEPSNKLQNANGLVLPGSAGTGAKTFYYDGVGNRTQESTTPMGGATTTDVLGYPPTSNRVVQITRHAESMPPA